MIARYWSRKLFFNLRPFDHWKWKSASFLERRRGVRLLANGGDDQRATLKIEKYKREGYKQILGAIVVQLKQE